MGDDGKRRDPRRYHAGRRPWWNRRAETSGDEEEVNLKMYSVFSGVKLFPYKWIIFQFWRPLAEDGRLVLECSRNVFAVSSFLPPPAFKYRRRCEKYQYSIDDVDQGDNPPWIISGGGPLSTAFLNHFPEVVLDLRGSPLLDCALECDFTCCVMLPVFYNHSSECLGVVECSMKHPAHLLPVFNEFKRALQRKGLHVQGSWPYKPIPGDLEPVKIEIEKGLKMACESHDLILGQVWISCECENANHASGTQMFLVKLSGYCLDDPPSAIKDFYDKLDVLPLKMGEGLAGKTLQTHQPHLCKNIFKLGDNKGVLALLSANTRCTSLAICLRSTHTIGLDYVFEFYWPCSRNHLILPETLLLTLRNYLPSFKFASGDDLSLVVDVENSSSASPIETRTSVGVKRMSIAGQSDLNRSVTNINNPEGDGDDDLAIFVKYRIQSLLLNLPSSSTYENVMEKLHREFQLDPARTYKVEYEVCPGQWSSLVCLESCRRRGDMGLIILRVLADGTEVGWQWRSNS